MKTTVISSLAEGKRFNPNLNGLENSQMEIRMCLSDYGGKLPGESRDRDRIIVRILCPRMALKCEYQVISFFCRYIFRSTNLFI